MYTRVPLAWRCNTWVHLVGVLGVLGPTSPRSLLPSPYGSSLSSCLLVRLLPLFGPALSTHDTLVKGIWHYTHCLDYGTWVFWGGWGLLEFPFVPAHSLTFKPVLTNNLAKCCEATDFSQYANLYSFGYSWTLSENQFFTQYSSQRTAFQNEFDLSLPMPLKSNL